MSVYRKAAPKPAPDPEPPKPSGPSRWQRLRRRVSRVSFEAWMAAAFVACVVGIVGLAVYVEVTAPRCLRGHTEQRWIYPGPIYVKVGDVMVPIDQPPYLTDVFVCDERAPE